MTRTKNLIPLMAPVLLGALVVPGCFGTDQWVALDVGQADACSCVGRRCGESDGCGGTCMGICSAAGQGCKLKNGVYACHCESPYCSGCCNSKGECITAMNTSACGAGGGACTDCTAMGSECSPYTCGTKGCEQVKTTLTDSKDCQSKAGKCSNGECCTGCIPAGGGCVKPDKISTSACGLKGEACTTCASTTCFEPSCSISSGVCQQSTTSKKRNWSPCTSTSGASGSAGNCFDGSCIQRWKTETSPSQEKLNSVWGTSKSNIVAVGDNGTVLRFGGSVWQDLSKSFASTADLYGVWGTTSALYVVGDTNLIYRAQPDGSFPVGEKVALNHLRSVWGSSAADVYAVGEAEMGGYLSIVHRNATSWKQYSVSVNSAYDLTAVWGANSSDIFALSNYPSNELFHLDGQTTLPIQQVSLKSSGTLVALWGVNATTLYLAGSAGNVYLCNVTSKSQTLLSPKLSPAPDFRAIWGTSSTDIFVVGTNGTILHYDGAHWDQQAVDWGSSVVQRLDAIWGLGAGKDVFVVGSKGTIIHYNAQAK